MKHRWADLRVWILNTWHKYSTWCRFFLEDLTHEIKQAGNYDLRLFIFVIAYVIFSAVGAYNFAHFTAFLYIIWLLERKA